MAYLGISATDDGLRVATGGDIADRLGSLLARIPGDAPIVILVHGYKFNPADPDADPNRSLYAFEPDPPCWKVRSWPAGLGFADDAGETGLAIGFGWPACEPHLPNLLRHGRTGFARVYDRAGDIGRWLAMLIAAVQQIAPGRPVDILAHSLGARVALSALPHLAQAPGRVILLGAAEFDARVQEVLESLPCPLPPQIYNVTARANDIYDFAFETFAPRRSWGDRALGHGLPIERPCWFDLQLDRPEVTAWINRRGIRLTAPDARLCHWAFYTRGGALSVYKAILWRHPGWDIASLRAVPALAVQEPRWSRLLRRIEDGNPAAADDGLAA